MQNRREQALEELRKAEQARDLLRELEGHLAEEDPEPERILTQLERLAQSLPETDSIRLLVESAVGDVRTRSPTKAGSDVSRARSAIEGKISTLEGSLGYGSE